MRSGYRENGVGRMDGTSLFWHNADMTAQNGIPAWQLYGEELVFPDVLHCERIKDRAAGLDWAISAHRHLHLHQFFLILRGKVQMRVDGRLCSVTVPAVLSMPCGVVHEFVFSQGTDGFVLTIPVQELPDLFGPGAETGPASRHFLSAPASALLPALFGRLIEVHRTSGAYRRTLLKALAAEIACDVLATAGPLPDNSMADPRMAGFTDCILAQFGQNPGLAVYAAQMGMSVRHLSRLCRAATGLSAQGYIDSLVFREACRLLAYTRMPVSAVGYQLGFDDPSYFSRAFRRQVGLSPSAYRDRLAG